MSTEYFDEISDGPSLDTIPRCNWKEMSHLGRVFLAELFGIGMIAFIIVIYKPDSTQYSSVPCVVGASFAWVICVMGPISGAQVNPAVSLALLMTRRLSIVHAVVSVVAQIVGASCGVLLGKVAGPANVTNVPNVGVTMRSPAISLGQAVGLEVFATMILVGLVLAVSDEFRSHPWAQGHLGVFPLMFGVMIFLLASTVGPYTGGSMNPALSLGAAFANLYFTDVWIYIVGPLTGSVLATVLYEMMLSEAASWARLKAMCTDPHFDRSKNYKLEKIKFDY